MPEAKRKLAAILSADVAGYSRLMQDDEAATVETLTKYRRVFADHIARHDGRVVDSPGDNLLAEFASPVEAVDAAVDIQHELDWRNRQLAEHRQMQFRIGLNLGDVIAKDDGTLYGDGVNIAARLESIAEPGGICTSETVHMLAKGKVEVAFEDLGEHEVKNIAAPVRAYRVRAGGVKSATRMDLGVAPALPDKPSIAVLPFTNMSSDPEQEYFADGITEDIITSLSRSRMFFVIARNSSFAYKGKTVDTQQIAQELGVRYVVEGSVRREKSRVRITAQLIDAPDDSHVWAEQYDRDLGDVFAVQDEIAEAIVTSITPEYLSAEIYRAHRRRAQSFDVWNLFMQAYWHYRTYTKDGHAEAKRLCHEAIERDPNAVGPIALLSQAHTIEALYGWSDSRDESLRLAREEALRAVRIDDHDTLALRSLGLVNLFCKRHDDAIHDFQRAVNLNPNESDNHANLGFALGLAGDYAAAQDHLLTALRISPRDILMWNWHNNLAMVAAVAGHDEEAIDWARKALQDNPDFPGAHRTLAACHGNLDQIPEARAALDALLRLQPGLTLARLRETLPVKGKANLERYLDGLRKAGLVDI